MQHSRRQLLAAAAAGYLSRRATGAGLSAVKIGVTDWNLGLTAKLEAVRMAASLGFEGVEVSLGREPVGNKLLLDDPALQRRYVEEAKRLGIRLAGACLDILHRNYLKSDKLGQKWLADAIPITRNLNAHIILLPFFGKGALETRQEMDYVADVLREIAPEAAKQGVILGLENTNSAADNARIMERSRSEAVRIYYDVGNSTKAGFDICKEIAWLGARRICQFHLKDNPHYLGEGQIDFKAVLKAIAALDFEGFANLETNAPSKLIEADMRRNLTYVRRLMEEARTS